MRTHADSVAAATTLAAGAGEATAQNAALQALLEGIQSSDEQVRTAAWRSAGEAGAAAVPGLAQLTEHQDLEVARAARRGLWQVVRQAGNPRTETVRQAVEAGLLELLNSNSSPALQHELQWMLSEIGGDAAVAPIAALLEQEALREDARMALERIPGKKARVALKKAFDDAPGDIKPALAVSLRNHGGKAPGVPDDKLRPVRPTSVQALASEGGAS